jgi:hypothetical protein
VLGKGIKKEFPVLPIIVEQFSLYLKRSQVENEVDSDYFFITKKG